MQIKIDKGLDVPIAGKPELTIDDAKSVKTVGLVGWDTPGLKPKMAVAVGDRVKLGQKLFIDKRNPDVCYTSPGSGTIAAVNRGERRVLNSVVVELDGDDAETFATSSDKPSDVRKTLCESGLWTTLRTRPFGRIPQPDTTPNSIFITAINTNPLAGEPALVIAEDKGAFLKGVEIVSRLTDGKVFVCTRPGTDIPCPEGERFVHAEFSGPHPPGSWARIFISSTRSASKRPFGISGTRTRWPSVVCSVMAACPPKD